MISLGCKGPESVTAIRNLARSEVSIQYESIQKKNALVLLSRAFLSCFEITYQFYQLVIYFINVHLAEKRIQDKQIPVFLK